MNLIELLKFPFHLENGLKLAAATAKIERLEKELHQCKSENKFMPEDFDWVLPEVGSTSFRVKLADFVNHKLAARTRRD
jgi:hypothetical protein